MFVDQAKIRVKGGDGGRGMVSFHTEKYVTNGGPDGGDGGKGGDIIMFATDNVSTLSSFRYRRKFVADNGENGGNRKMFGRGGQDLRLPVPVGTIIRDIETGKIIADFVAVGQECIIANGGKGGQGNIHFCNSVRQAPNFARAGIPGEEFELQIELKLIADVGLVGLPNAGKSTLLSVISSAKPKIANYPFTTLEPILGVVNLDDMSFVVADIPGLIEGAHEGAGLGHDFLRHIERTRLLIHVVDVSGEEGRDPLDDFNKITDELKLYDHTLLDRPRIVVANKIDQTDPKQLKKFITAMKKRGLTVFPVSAAIAEGTRELVQAIAAILPTIPRPVQIIKAEEEKLYKFEEKDPISVTVVDGVFVVEGEIVRSISESTNFDDPDSLSYFQRIIRKKGVIDALIKAGVREGDPVKLYEIEFEYIS